MYFLLFLFFWRKSVPVPVPATTEQEEDGGVTGEIQTALLQLEVNRKTLEKLQRTYENIEKEIEEEKPSPSCPSAS